MLLRIISDVHMEQYRHSTVPVDIKWDRIIAPVGDRDADAVLILAGDICEFGDLTFFANGFKELAKRFKAIVYVPGNHEYFGPSTPYGPQTFFYFKELLRRWGKIHLLDNGSVTIEGQEIWGATLWTNYDNNCTAVEACRTMGDFRHSKTYHTDYESRIAIPQDYVDRNDAAVAALTAKLELNPNLVIVTHFAPSHQSIHDRYKDSNPYEQNFHFVNELDELMLGNPIKLWVHGHTHTPFDYLIGSTRVVCNPTGWQGEGGVAEGIKYVEV